MKQVASCITTPLAARPACRCRRAHKPLASVLRAKTLALALALLGSLPVHANEALRFSGFGTLGFSADNRQDIAPVRDISQRPSEGHQTGNSWKPDTRLGLQLEYALQPNIDLVGQLVVRHQYQADFNSSVELAYVALRPHPQFDLRLGRISYDTFLMADHRNVGYAYPWIRPTTEFYGWVPVFSLNGIDIAHNIETDAGRWRIKAQVGQSTLDLPIGPGYYQKIKNLHGVSVTYQTDAWRLKSAWSRFRNDGEVPAFAPLHSGLDTVAAAGIPGVSTEAADLRRHLTFDGNTMTFTTLGAAYDDGAWVGQAELGHTTSTAAVAPHGNIAYAAIGRRFGDWMPHVRIATSRPAGSQRQSAHDWGALNATVRDPALLTVNTTRIEQNSLSIGTRWDFHRQAALKLQWDRTWIKPSGYGIWWREITLNNQSSRIDQLSATLDFVF